MTNHPSVVKPVRVPFLDHGGAGAALVFLHANGYPPACYEPLLDRLAGRYRTLAMFLRPLWPDSRPEEIRDWAPLSADLLRFLDEQKLDPVVAVGHSMGAIVALRAALWAPARFRALILLEPVLMPRHVMLEWRMARSLGVGNWLHPLIPRSRKRRRSFEDLEQVFSRYRRRRIFRYFADENLRLFIAGMTRRTADGGYALVFSPEWETHIYYSGVWNDADLWRDMPTLSPPTLMIRGSETDTFRASAARRALAMSPMVKLVTLPKSTHLVALEQPEPVFEHLRTFLDAARVD